MENSFLERTSFLSLLEHKLVYTYVFRDSGANTGHSGSVQPRGGLGGHGGRKGGRGKRGREGKKGDHGITRHSESLTRSVPQHTAEVTSVPSWGSSWPLRVTQVPQVWGRVAGSLESPILRPGRPESPGLPAVETQAGQMFQGSSPLPRPGVQWGFPVGSLIPSEGRVSERVSNHKTTKPKVGVATRTGSTCVCVSVCVLCVLCLTVCTCVCVCVRVLCT